MEILETREIRVMRNMAWERAKGELKSMLWTHYDFESAKFDNFNKAVNDFIQKVEDEALHE